MNINHTPGGPYMGADPIGGQYDSRLANLFATSEIGGGTIKIGARVGETLLDVAMRAGLSPGLLESQDVSMPLNARMMPGEVITLSVSPTSIDAVSVESPPMAQQPSAAETNFKQADPFANVDWRINLQTNRAPQLYASESAELAATQDFGRGLQALSDYLDIDAYNLSGSLKIDGNTFPVSYG